MNEPVEAAISAIHPADTADVKQVMESRRGEEEGTSISATYSAEFLETVKPRRLARSLEDYWRSVGDSDNENLFSLGYQWADKPHRHVFDLIAYALHLEETIASSQLSNAAARETTAPPDRTKVMRELQGAAGDE